MKDALELDRKNSNTYWSDAIPTEMKNVKAAFRILPDGTTAPNGYQKISCHMIFDIMMEDFRRKARLVVGDIKLKPHQLLPILLTVGVATNDRGRYPAIRRRRW